MEATGVFSSCVTALMKASCCSLRRISRTRKMVFSTTPLTISASSSTPKKTQDAGAPVEHDPADIEQQDDRDEPGAERQEERDRFLPAGNHHDFKLTPAGRPGVAAPMQASAGGVALTPRSDGRGDAEQAEEPDLHPGGIELVPGQPVPRRGGVRVVVVVPALAEGEEGDPPVVARIVVRLEPARAPHVRGGVHQPGGVQPEHDAEAQIPHSTSGRPPMATSSAARATVGTQW